MNRIYNQAFFLIFSAFGTLAFAQETKMLTTDEAVDLGIRNSKSLKIDEAQIREAAVNLTEAKDRKLPSLKVSGSALALAHANVDLKMMSGGGGGTKPNSAFFGNLSASMPLFAGGRLKYGVQSAELLIEASKLNAENDKQNVAYTILQAYNNLFKAEQMIKVLQENLSASRKRDETFLKLENNGVIPRNDRLKANLQTSNIELQLLEAENNFAITNVNMDLLLGLPETTQIKLDSQYDTEISGSQPLQYYLGEALSHRNDLKSLDLKRKALALGTKAAKAENLPSIALTGGYVAAEVPNVLTVTNAANIGLGVSYNIDQLWKSNTNWEKSKIQEEQLDARNALLNDQIKLEVSHDYQNAELAKKKIEVYEKAYVQAEENYRITKNKYDNGLSTMTELLDADAAKISASMNVITSKADAALAYKKLLQTTGILTIN